MNFWFVKKGMQRAKSRALGRQLRCIFGCKKVFPAQGRSTFSKKERFFVQGCVWWAHLFTASVIKLLLSSLLLLDVRTASFVLCVLGISMFSLVLQHFQLCGSCINGVEWCEGGMCGGQRSTSARTSRLQECHCRFHTGNNMFLLKATWRQECGPGRAKRDVSAIWKERFPNEILKCAPCPGGEHDLEVDGFGFGGGQNGNFEKYIF